MQVVGNDTLMRPVRNIEVSIENGTDSVYTTGEYYRIERLCEDRWEVVPLKYGTFEDLGYSLAQNGGTQRFTISLQNVEHSYQQGTYRICKRVGNGVAWREVYCEFVVR